MIGGKLAALAALATLAFAGQALADVKLLSAGAVEPGVTAALRDFSKTTGIKVEVAFATGPELLRRIGGGEAADVVIAPDAVMDQLVQAKATDGAHRTPLGRVGVGVAVRDGAAKPDLSSPEALKAAVETADKVVINQASTGKYVEAMLKKLGLDVAGKTEQLADGNAVMARLRDGKGREIGFGAITEIMLWRERGVTLAGPLPAAVQNETAYAAAPGGKAADPAEAQKLIAYLAGPGRVAFEAAGIR